tara:strand:+ start:74 stop:466 length:393 start_codon:yes stop_codon:yes gene_type:complete
LSLRTGRVGDLIAASVIESFGADVVVVNREGYDLLVDWQDNWIKVEIKSTQAKELGRNCWTFRTASGNKAKKRLIPTTVDIVGLVVIPRRKVAFTHISQIKSVTTRIFEDRFQALDERESWDQACELLNQ